MITGGEAAGRLLRELGVEVTFGVAGTQNVHLLEGLRRASIRFVPGVSEVGAAFMANGHYRASGRPGVLVTSGGPGFTMALTGIAEAREDSAGLLWLACGRSAPAGMRYALQDLDEDTMAGPVVKSVWTVSRPGAVEDALPEALREVVQDEPGPVLVRLMEQALAEPMRRRTAGGVRAPEDEAGGDSAEGATTDDEVLSRVADRLRRARRPILYAGQGAVEAAGTVDSLARRTGAAILTTTSGRGVVPEDDPRVVPVDGPGHDTDALNDLLDRSDLVLVLGAKLSQNGSHGFRLRLDPRRTVRVDADADALQANYPASVAIRGPIPEVLAGLERSLGAAEAISSGWTDEELEGWRRRVAAPPDRMAGRAGIADGSPRDLPGFVRLLRRVLPRDGIVVTDSGRHQMVVRRHHRVLAPRGLMVPSDFQSMGFGIPAAVGAKLAAPDRPVLAVVGDGGFAMTGMELVAAVREGVTLPVLVFSDGELALIRDQQVDAWGHGVGTDLAGFSAMDLARSTGARHRILQGPLEEALRRLLSEPGVTVGELVLKPTARARVRRARAATHNAARRLLRPRTQGPVPSDLPSPASGPNRGEGS